VDEAEVAWLKQREINKNPDALRLWKENPDSTYNDLQSSDYCDARFNSNQLQEPDTCGCTIA
jgi:hypothetical protein